MRFLRKTKKSQKSPIFAFIRYTEFNEATTYYSIINNNSPAAWFSLSEKSYSVARDSGRISKSADVRNSVSIGEFRFKLYGYTSPYAFITFEGLGIFDQTTANNKGYFEFNNRFSPFSPREACLSSKISLAA